MTDPPAPVQHSPAPAASTAVRLFRITEPLASALAETLSQRGWQVRHVQDVDFAAEPEPAAWLVVGAASGDREPIELILKLRTSRRRDPILVLHLQDVLALMRGDPEWCLLGAEGVSALRLPARCGDLFAALGRLSETARFDRFEALCLGPSKLRADRVREHDLRNAFGPRLLVEGARLEGDLDQSAYEDLVAVCERSAAVPVSFGGHRDELEQLLTRSDEPAAVRGRQAPGEGLRLLLLDDQASQGWQTVLKRLLGARELLAPDAALLQRDCEALNRDSGAPRQPLREFEATQTQVLAALRGEGRYLDLDGVLLDLRLAPGSDPEAVDSTDGVRDFSGARFLEMLRLLDPTVPVVLFSATEKSLHVRGLQEMGLDDVFTKGLWLSGGEFASSLRNVWLGLRDAVERLRARVYLRGLWQAIQALAGALAPPARQSLIRGFAALQRHSTRAESKLLGCSSHDEAVLAAHMALEDQLNVWQPINWRNPGAPRTVGERVNQLAPEARDLGRVLVDIRNKAYHGDWSADEASAVVCMVALLGCVACRGAGAGLIWPPLRAGLKRVAEGYSPPGAVSSVLAGALKTWSSGTTPAQFLAWVARRVSEVAEQASRPLARRPSDRDLPTAAGEAMMKAGFHRTPRKGGRR